MNDNLLINAFSVMGRIALVVDTGREIVYTEDEDNYLIYTLEKIEANTVLMLEDKTVVINEFMIVDGVYKNRYQLND